MLLAICFILYVIFSMKFNTLVSAIMAATILWSVTLMPVVSFAQTNDDLIDSILSDSATRWYAATDKDAVKVISKTATTATIEAPVAKKDGQIVTSYYITWAPISYSQIASVTSNSDDLAKVKDSDDYKTKNNKDMYEIQGEKLIFTIEIADPSRDVYVTIAPEDANRNTWAQIEDFTFNLATVNIWWVTSTTSVAGDVHDTTLNQAIVDASCIWDATANRVTLFWALNTAYPNATKVEIYHRGDETVGDMTLKGTPNITDRRFPVDTPHRNIQLFRFKPVDAAGTMIGTEIMYTCKPDSSTANNSSWWSSVDPNNPIPVTPHTGPVETAAIVFFVSLLGYVVYRKVKRV